MNKIKFKSQKNKEEFYKTSEYFFGENFDSRILKLYDKYFIKDEGLSKGLNMLLIENSDDEIYIDKILLSEMLNENNIEKYKVKLAILINFICELRREKKTIIANKRCKSKMDTDNRNCNCGYNTISNVIYEKSVNKNTSRNIKCCKWSVRGHFRKLKNGREIFIGGYDKKWLTN